MERNSESNTQGKHDRRETSSMSLFLLFLKIGATAFGGYMALIAVVQDYMVKRKRLLTEEDMLDGISLATVLPGPVAANVVAYAGYRIGGTMGAVAGVVGVILPSFLLLLGLSYVYFQFGQMPVVGKIFTGFAPAVAAIIFAAALNMGKKMIKGVPEAIIALGAFALIAGVGGISSILGTIVISGLIGVLLFRNAGPVIANQTPPALTGNRKHRSRNNSLHAIGGAFGVGLPWLAIGKLVITFSGMSLLLFGGGWVFIPMIQQVLVDKYGWITRQEFIDAIALGQVTPGPILISVAFIGYKVAGVTGATASTIAIFAPSAVVMVLCTSFLERIKESMILKAALQGIRPAIIGMVVAAGVTVVGSMGLDGISISIFGFALVALLWFKVETAWIIPVAGAVRLLV